MIEIKNIYKSYDKTEVLHGISLQIAPGEIHGLIGENSAGKTTLMKCVAGVYKAEKGEILLDEEPVFDNPKAKLNIGYVADYNEYIRFYSCVQMVKMYQRFYPDFDIQKLNELNQMFHLPLEKNVSALSKGQKMRLSIMLEIAKKPKYLIMDEPTSGLDPMAKEAFYNLLIKEAEENGTGVLISSHNLYGLEKICDSLTMLHGGRVEHQMSMDSMKGVLTKLQVVFEGGASPVLYERKDLLRISNIGSIYTLVMKDFDADKEAQLKELGATFIEPVALSLEELFVTLEGTKQE